MMIIFMYTFLTTIAMFHTNVFGNQTILTMLDGVYEGWNHGKGIFLYGGRG